MELSVLLNKMFVFVVLMVIGYVLARRGVLDRSFTKAASSLTLNVFMAATIVSWPGWWSGRCPARRNTSRASSC